MNKFRMVKAGINVNQGLERLSGDAELYEDLLIKFLDDTHYQEMLTAIENKEVQEAFSAAHSLKGIAGNLSLTKLYDAIYPVVEELRNGNIEVADQLPEIDEIYQKAITAINDLK